jgi:hypothetical protein
MKIISLGRAKYRLITLSPIIQNNDKTFIFTDYPISIFKCFIFCLLNSKNKVDIFFCDGNINNINYFIIKFFLKIKKKNIIWFNNSLEIKFNDLNNEFEHWTFFPEQIKYLSYLKKKKCLITSPRKISLNRNYFEYNLSYISEVKKDINKNFYPNLFNLDNKFKNTINQNIWMLIKNKNLSTISNFDLIYNYFKKIFIEKKIEYNNSIFIEIYSLLKNRIRFTGVKLIQKKFPGSLILIGKTWSEYGFETFDQNNDYNYERNIDIYKKTKIPLDFGSNSGEYPLYLRTYEIIKNSNWLIQTRTRFSKLFEKFEKKITFNSFEEMLLKIKFTLNLKDDFLILEKKKFILFFNNNKNLSKNTRL